MVPSTPVFRAGVFLRRPEKWCQHTKRHCRQSFLDSLATRKKVVDASNKFQILSFYHNYSLINSSASRHHLTEGDKAQPEHKRPLRRTPTRHTPPSRNLHKHEPNGSKTINALSPRLHPSPSLKPHAKCQHRPPPPPPSQKTKVFPRKDHIQYMLLSPAPLLLRLAHTLSVFRTAGSLLGFPGRSPWCRQNWPRRGTAACSGAWTCAERHSGKRHNMTALASTFPAKERRLAPHGKGWGPSIRDPSLLPAPPNERATRAVAIARSARPRHLPHRARAGKLCSPPPEYKHTDIVNAPRLDTHTPRYMKSRL